MAKPYYYLTFRRRAACPDPQGPPAYGRQETVFTDRAPLGPYKELKAVGLCVAYGREGDKPTRDSHPQEAWDQDAGENKPSGAKS